MDWIVKNILKLDRKIKLSLFLLLSYFTCCNAFAENRTIDLNIGYKTVNFSGKTTKAFAVNDQIPAPTLHFKQGDNITINVHNNLDEATAIHWHGVLVPWQMDGVEGVSQKGIPPGGTFQYQFTLEQAGTYWYHAHAVTQEQDGFYGAFIIDPPSTPDYKYTKDYVVVLSDWDNAKGAKILRNLKKDGDYYSPRFPLQPSLKKFMHDYRQANCEEREKLLNDYKMMQQMRMSIYDLSDVAYDTYLLNGQPKSCPWTAPVKVGDIVRLRFIGAAGSTIYRIKIDNSKMKMIHIQGNDIQPYMTDDFSIAPGETYDVLVKIEKNCPYIIYAESIDTRGKAYGALVTNVDQCIEYEAVAPFPEPDPVTRTMMSNMMMSEMDHGSKKGMNHGSMKGMNHVAMNEKDHGSMKGMDHGSKKGMNHGSMKGMNHRSMKSLNEHEMNMKHSMHMDMPLEPTLVGDTISSLKTSQAITKGTKYKKLKAAVETNDPNKPVTGVIKMELFGYMERFIWFINGLPEHKAKPIAIEPGKRYRIVFTNNSMMRHSMHIHGHWFILRKGNGAYDPLLHTIEVAPGETIIADFDSDASGQWFFHCHHLYHMMSGMARIFQYKTIIEVANGTAKPENLIIQQKYFNRAIVRVDEVIPIDHSLIQHPMAHPPGFYVSSYLDIGEDPFHNVQKITFKGLYGEDYNKLQLYTEDAEVKKGKVENADIDIFYWWLISQFWAVKGGINYFYRPAKNPYLQPGIGIEGLMPYFIETNARSYYHRGSVKLDVELSRDSQMTNNFFIRTGVRSILASKTVVKDEIGSGLNQMRYTLRPYYRIAPGINVFVEYEHEQGYGVLKRILKNLGEPTREDTLTFGIAVLF